MTKASVAACATLLCAGTVLAAPTAQRSCDNARVTAWKTYLSCVEVAVAKDAKATDFDYFATFAKCRHTYSSQWGKFQTKASFAGSTCIGSRFTDNGDQTVTDFLSGLVWEKKTDDGSAHDKDNAYTWSTGAPYAENGTAFTGFLATVNGGGGFAGANGWRLPTLAELQTIVLDFACTGPGFGPTCSCPSNPCVDSALGSGNTQSFYYWSATSYVPGADSAWSVKFSDGSIDAGSKTFGGTYARAVRGGL